MVCSSVTEKNDRATYFPNAPRILIYEPVREKTNNLDSDQVRDKQGCTATGDG